MAYIVSHRRANPLRTALVTTFHDTVNFCFDSVLETMGTSVRDVVHGRLTNRGIPPSDDSIRRYGGDSIRILRWGCPCHRLQDNGRALPTVFEECRLHVSGFSEGSHVSPERKSCDRSPGSQEGSAR